ncbi:MAG: TerC/Alx family metal homeostasis membrane protein [Chloracidobacterium sp.]|uniref:TerC/Alx family metal homeostasis membrane protein n=1 Tax=Chloracidobacterium validum TaxID=2821543 RepID=A0ABX8B6D1_9BACT|nr:TerC/Alx family metal homeostasis membrane protein [Chloracidobacterium validum]QUW02531.1 TerC/Alx family metal homeostasis membrane protein [Chloracidobacterium validum]
MLPCLALSGTFPSVHFLVFITLVIVFLWIDLASGQGDRPVSMTKAAVWSVIWVAVSLGFAGYVAVTRGNDDAVLFITAYALEKSLAVDNLFVFMAIFSAFAIPEYLHHRILYWGIIGALLFRALFIGLGVGLLFGAGALGTLTVFGLPIEPQRVIFFLFGLVILWSVYALFRAGHRGTTEEAPDYTNHWAVFFLRQFFPNRIATQLDRGRFLTKVVDGQGNHRHALTPAFLCLLVIEASDIMFAFDSVPAIFAVTQDPFLVYTSNIFAVLGLRSMYFLVAAAKRMLIHLDKAVFIILAFIGVKMLALAFDWFHLPPLVSLGVVLGLLALGVGASLFVRPGQVGSEISK